MEILTAAQMDALRASGRINAEVHAALATQVVAGGTGKALEQVAKQMIHDAGGHSSFEREGRFPACLCVSINDEIGHGLPSERPFQPGDVVKVDLGVEFDGIHTDCAHTYLIGPYDDRAERLVRAAYRALYDGIAAAQPGHRISDISYAVARSVHNDGWEIVRHAFGHGIGARLHQPPQIPSFGPPGRGARLRVGTAITIEPVVVAGLRYTRTLADGWTTVTVDGSLAAHVEHTVLISNDGPEVVTAMPASSHEDARPRLGDPLTRPSAIDVGGHSIDLHSLGPADMEEALALAHRTMDSVLVEAWGRRVHPNDLFGRKGSQGWVCRDAQGDLAAFVIFEKVHLLHVHILAVAEAWQGTGLAHGLFDVLEQAAAESGLPGLELWVQENNLRAIRFYQHRGFQDAGVPYVNTRRMIKRL
ncbi:hypothetical protein GCM10025857_30750 [Alicyclobacillus contaminans]|uniref:type I methionyl aminopeptidase n=1 Tax=Alicyclobacillus contaminans TaxID=392016 RepID=UPI000400266C|nr:type I methionyl aminopeptidase [Alicyclobacillus contaminans]GMA51718.1 hypothetical protein GCM10025857_30750 [Alicyclobacillus contaminans]